MTLVRSTQNGILPVVQIYLKELKKTQLNLLFIILTTEKIEKHGQQTH